MSCHSFGGFHRFNRARSASIPAASIFAHSAGGSRIDRNTITSSGGFGGLPRGRFSCSMRPTVAPIYRDTNNPCIPDLSCYIKSMTNERDADMEPIMDHEYRRANLSRFQGQFWSDWQLDEGAKMDQPQWVPRGSTTRTRYTAGKSWHLVSGHDLRFTPASHQTVYVRHDGALYRTEWNLQDQSDHVLMHCSEIRKVSKGARPLRRTRLFSKVEDLARSEVLR